MDGAEKGVITQRGLARLINLDQEISSFSVCYYLRILPLEEFAVRATDQASWRNLVVACFLLGYNVVFWSKNAISSSPTRVSAISYSVMNLFWLVPFSVLYFADFTGWAFVDIALLGGLCGYLNAARISVLGRASNFICGLVSIGWIPMMFNYSNLFNRILINEPINILGKYSWVLDILGISMVLFAWRARPSDLALTHACRLNTLLPGLVPFDEPVKRSRKIEAGFNAALFSVTTVMFITFAAVMGYSVAHDISVLSIPQELLGFMGPKVSQQACLLVVSLCVLGLLISFMPDQRTGFQLMRYSKQLQLVRERDYRQSLTKRDKQGDFDDQNNDLDGEWVESKV